MKGRIRDERLNDDGNIKEHATTKMNESQKQKIRENKERYTQHEIETVHRHCGHFKACHC